MTMTRPGSTLIRFRVRLFVETDEFPEGFTTSEDVNALTFPRAAAKAKRIAELYHTRSDYEDNVRVVTVERI